jgi:sterol 3beta-glucosyltransferase
MKRLYSPVIATYLAILTLGISLFFQTFGLPSKHLSHLTPKGLPPSKITCLTIGSRGDVQPFIALGLGLQQDGHTVTIATHLEFKDMIEESGIAFKNIGGNPQELIKHCVEHGALSRQLLTSSESFAS